VVEVDGATLVPVVAFAHDEGTRRVNNPAHWNNFAVALAGVAAVLAGLVFVALSVNLERILQVPGLPGRAGETLIVLIGVVVQCGLLLIPGLNRVTLGVSLMVVGVLEWATVTAVSVSGARQQTAEPRSWNLARVIYVQIATIPVAVAGLLLVINASGALYWLAGAVLWSVVAGSGNAWVLIVEIVRDARYRPLDQKEQS
jgi:modulator of FtsH protease